MSNTFHVYLPRAVAKEVLRGWNKAYADVAISKCTWEGVNGFYSSSCGGYRRMESKECRGFKFCPSCGGEIEWKEVQPVVMSNESPNPVAIPTEEK